MLIRACMIIRIQPFDQHFFRPFKSRCFQSKKLNLNKTDEISRKTKLTSPIPDGSAAFFVSRAHMVFFVFTICCVLPFLTVPHYTIILSYTIIDLLRFFHPMLLFHPILLLIFVHLSTLYHYFALYYYSGLQSTY